MAAVLMLLAGVLAGCSNTGGSYAVPPPMGQKDEQRTRQQVRVDEQLIPYDDLLRYPTNWPDLTEQRNLGSETPPPRWDVNSDELWIIQKSEAPPAEMDEYTPGTGALLAKQEKELLPIPLKHTDVKASIVGYIATTTVTQQYHNPFDDKIEAVYMFPLPHNAAINEFIMTVGSRRIRGIIRERQEAQRIYQEAREQGYVASLLTQERPNVFTQSVANIEPGKSIDIQIRYFSTLAYTDGDYEYVFPMVVGPRFNPPHIRDGIGAVGVGSRGVSGQSREIQYLRPSQRNGHDIALAVRINAGVALEHIESRNHRINVRRAETTVANVKLTADDYIPNRDFVLRYKVAGTAIKSTMMVKRDGQGGFFTLMLFPPEDLRELPRKPLELVFTLDVSGSMSGEPIAQSKAAIRYALAHMGPDDTFQIIRFANGASQLASGPVSATQENVRRGLRFIESTEAGGGTMMAQGIRASLDFPHDENRLRFVTFLTDGYIGNEQEILKQVHDSLGPSRIFSFGVGSSPNRYLLDHMAKMGSGAVAYVGLHDNANQVMARFFQRISHPAMTDMHIDWGGMRVGEVYPSRIPDLFVGRPVILTGRFRGEAPEVITVKGRIGGRVQSLTVPVRMDESSEHEGIACVWARAKIAQIAERAMWDEQEKWLARIKEVALEYGLMSPFTAFVAVDSMTRTVGDYGTRLSVPVPVPEGVRYETTVEEKP